MYAFGFSLSVLRYFSFAPKWGFSKKSFSKMRFLFAEALFNVFVFYVCYKSKMPRLTERSRTLSAEMLR